MLEEVGVEANFLIAKHSNTVTNRKKEGKWKAIAEKVSACGVALREWTEVREKFKKMRSEVLNRQQYENRRREAITTCAI